MASTRICVRLLSGDVVYEGLRPHGLAELQDEVAATLGCECDELSFCSGDAVLSCLEDADEQITVVRDEVMGLLDEFVKCSLFSKLPEHLWPAREHRRLMLAAVAHNGDALQHASAELRADRDIILAAVTNNAYALRYASPELRADRDVVMAAVESKGYALGFWPATKLQTSRQPDVHLNVGATITVAL